MTGTRSRSKLLVALAMVFVLVSTSGCGKWRDRLVEYYAKDIGDKILDFLGLNEEAVAKDFVDDKVINIIIEVSKRDFGCKLNSPALLAAQIFHESTGNINVENSDAGAMGISQFMEDTWNGNPKTGQQAMKRDGDGDGIKDIRNPWDAIHSQANYNCVLYEEVKNVPGDPVANTLAAYNAGGPAVRAAGGIPQNKDTPPYVEGIMKKMREYAKEIAGGDGADGQPASTFGLEIVRQARAQIGKPYVWGGESLKEGGFDCSGLVVWSIQHARNKLGLKDTGFPRVTGPQLNFFNGKTPVEILPGGTKPAKAAAGDIMFVWNAVSPPTAPDHVVIISGPGKMIEAPRPGRNILEENTRIYDNKYRIVHRLAQ